MASHNAQQPDEAPSGGAAGQRGLPERRVAVTVDGEALAAMLADQERFQRTVEGFLEVSTRESGALRRVIDRQEGVIASLRQQVADLTRRVEGPAAPSEDGKPL